MKNHRKNKSAKPFVNLNSAHSSNGVSSPEIATAVTEVLPMDDSRGNGLIKELSTFVGLQLCDDLDAAKDVLRDDFHQLEATVNEHGEWITVCDAQYASLSGDLIRDRDDHNIRFQVLNNDLGDTMAKVDAVASRVDHVDAQIDTVLTEVAALLNDHRRDVAARFDGLAAKSAEERQSTTDHFVSIDAQLGTLAQLPGVIRHLGSEIAANRTAIRALNDRIIGGIADVNDKMAADRTDAARAIEHIVSSLEARRADQDQLRAEITARRWGAQIARSIARLRSLGNFRERCD
jgi:hypothetical protein